MKISRLLLITVGVAAGMVGWQWLVHPLSIAFQWFFFAALVFIVGIPHGALDLYVQQQSNQLSGKPFHTFSFLVKYCSAIILYAVAWYLFPALAFSGFLLISCLHFGETDLTYFAPDAPPQKPLAILYGAALLLILLLPHTQEVTVVVSQLLPAYRALPGYLYFLQLHAFTIMGIAVVAAACIIGVQGALQKNNSVLPAALQLLVLLSCCSLLPLLPAFALYFVGWHSFISLHQIGRYIGENSTTGSDQRFVGPLLKKGLPFSALAMAGLVVAYFLLPLLSFSFHPLPLVLIFLSLITLPHLQVMNELNKKLSMHHPHLS